jgi:hypothetical protein
MMNNSINRYLLANLCRLVDCPHLKLHYDKDVALDREPQWIKAAYY